jgi:hypothetical protein
MSRDAERKAGRMGALILLRRVREEAERRELAAASEAEERARAAEADLDGRRRAVEDQLSRLRGEPSGEQPPAQVLQFQSRFERTLWAIQVRMEMLLATACGERITAAEAAARARAELAAARRAREHLCERQAAVRREQRRRREQAEEDARDGSLAGFGTAGGKGEEDGRGGSGPG